MLLINIESKTNIYGLQGSSWMLTIYIGGLSSLFPFTDLLKDLEEKVCC